MRNFLFCKCNSTRTGAPSLDTQLDSIIMLKKTIALLAILGIGTAVIAFKPSATKVAFAELSWDAAKQKAIADKKLFFVEFDASYCATCRNMDQSTYMDNTLATFIEQNVVALRVDVQDFDGVMWSQQYDVEALPTMLVFDPSGKLVKRMVGYKSATDLVKTFQEAKTGTTSTTTTNANTISTSTIATSTNTPKPVTEDRPLRPVTTTTANTTPTTKPNAGAAPSLFGSTTTTTANTPTASLGMFEIAVRRQESKGFSVQVGSFSSYETVLDQADMMRELYEQKTIVAIDKNSGQTMYKLLVGVFGTRSDAQKFQETLRKNNMDGIVKDLRVM